jgi:NADH-quinone oxidoreductase subunit J
VLLVETVYVFFANSEQSAKIVTDFRALLASAGDPTSAGVMLFNEYLLPFEVTSVLLLVAMIGAIVLTKKEQADLPE